MASIMQGTTPTVTITIDPNDLDLANVTAVELCVRNGTALSTYTADDLTLDTDANSLTKVFTEEETAAFDPSKNVIIQGRFWVGDAVIGINKISIGVSDMLGVGKDG